MHAKNLRAYLDSAAGIASLLPQAERLIELRHIYGKLVPEQLLRSSSVVNCRQQMVVIFAENNAIAAKLRLLTPRLINDFSKFGVEVTGIRIEVQPQQSPPKIKMPKQARLSLAGAQTLQSLAEQLPHSELKQALAGMASRGMADATPDQPARDDQGGEPQPEAK